MCSKMFSDSHFDMLSAQGLGEASAFLIHVLPRTPASAAYLQPPRKTANSSKRQASVEELQFKASSEDYAAFLELVAIFFLHATKDTSGEREAEEDATPEHSASRAAMSNAGQEAVSRDTLAMDVQKRCEQSVHATAVFHMMLASVLFWARKNRPDELVQYNVLEDLDIDRDLRVWEFDSYPRKPHYNQLIDDAPEFIAVPYRGSFDISVHQGDTAAAGPSHAAASAPTPMPQFADVVRPELPISQAAGEFQEHAQEPMSGLPAAILSLCPVATVHRSRVRRSHGLAVDRKPALQGIQEVSSWSSTHSI
jgi:hypothetical protein